MRILMTMTALLLAAPLSAQAMQGMDHSKMDQGKTEASKPAMDQSKMDHSKMDHSKMDHSKMDHGKMGDGKKMDCMGADGQCKMMGAMKNSAANPYAEASMASHKAMMAAMGSDAAETWTRKMIEHHRGGIAMSKIALTEAKDADTQASARKLIAAQDKEIVEYQAWLKSHGKAAQ